MTRSLPLVRPSRAFAFSEFLSPLPKRLKFHPMGEGEVAPAFLAKYSHWYIVVEKFRGRGFQKSKSGRQLGGGAVNAQLAVGVAATEGFDSTS